MEFDLIVAILASLQKLIQHSNFLNGVKSYYFGIFFLQLSRSFRNLNLILGIESDHGFQS